MEAQCQYCWKSIKMLELNPHEDECDKNPNKPLSGCDPMNDPQTGPESQSPPASNIQDSLPSADEDIPHARAAMLYIEKEMKNNAKFRNTVFAALIVMLTIIVAMLAVFLYPRKSKIDPMTEFDLKIDRQIALKVIGKFESLINDELETIFTEKFQHNINKLVLTQCSDQFERIATELIQPLQQKFMIFVLCSLSAVITACVILFLKQEGRVQELRNWMLKLSLSVKRFVKIAN